MSTLTFFMGECMKTKKLILGVGTNDADYVTQKYEITEVNGLRKQKRVWICPYYQAWTSMLSRCYSSKLQESYPTYKGCTVSVNWLTFSNFKVWMAAQDWEDRQLDKDLLVKGNKAYSPETCVFISGVVNGFTTDSKSSRGEWLIGVDWYKPAGKFRSKCSNPFTKKLEHLGYFTCQQQAHQAWLKRKLELAHELAAIQEDPRVAKALTDRYSKPQEQVV